MLQSVLQKSTNEMIGRFEGVILFSPSFN